MMKEKPRLAVDMDEVIADSHSYLLGCYERMFGHRWTTPQCEGVALRDLATAEEAAAVDAILHEGSVYRNFSVIPGSREALQELAEIFDIFITSAAMDYPGGCFAKFAWLQSNFPFIHSSRIVFCGDKRVIHADVMIDDQVRNLRSFCGTGVLFRAPHNKYQEWPLTACNWEDALATLKRLALR